MSVVISHDEQHSLTQSTLLHLAPGLGALLVYTLLTRPIQAMGYPSIAAWLIAVQVNILFEFGYLLWQGQQHSGRLTLRGVLMHEPMKVKDILLWSVVTFLAVLVLYLLSGPVAVFLETTVFAWVPPWFHFNYGTEGGGLSRSAIIVTNLVGLLVFVIVIPLAEESYFRGYLLPRLSRFAYGAVILNSFLFALYHFTTPWYLFTRTLFTLPLAYVALRRKNIIPSIIVHAIANAIDPIMALMYAFSL